MLALYTLYCLSHKLPVALFPFGAIPVKHPTSASIEHLDYSHIVEAEGANFEHLVEGITMGLSLLELRSMEAVMMDSLILIASSKLEDNFKDVIVALLSNIGADFGEASQRLQKLVSRIGGAVDLCVWTFQLSFELNNAHAVLRQSSLML
jgi:hypothetical protein